MGPEGSRWDWLISAAVLWHITHTLQAPWLGLGFARSCQWAPLLLPIPGNLSHWCWNVTGQPQLLQITLCSECTVNTRGGSSVSDSGLCVEAGGDLLVL